MRADWTRRDPAITEALRALGRSGVPVYALYAPRRRGTRSCCPRSSTRVRGPGGLDALAGTRRPLPDTAAAPAAATLT